MPDLQLFEKKLNEVTLALFLLVFSTAVFDRKLPPLPPDDVADGNDDKLTSEGLTVPVLP